MWIALSYGLTRFVFDGRGMRMERLKVTLRCLPVQELLTTTVVKSAQVILMHAIL